MRKLFSNFDWGIFACAVVLLILGLAIIRSVAPDNFSHQLIFAFIGLLFFFIFSQIDYRLYPRLKGIFYFISLFGLVLTFIFGAVTRGSVRWIKIGDFTLQFSELVKPLLIASFASFLTFHPAVSLRTLIKNLFLLFVPIILIFSQPDLGSSLVVVSVWLGMLLVARTPLRVLFTLGIFLFLILPFGWFALKSYQQTRIISFINPFADPLSSGYSIIQSMVSVGSGKVFGRGLGWGTQSHLRFLPERHTDFIFASLSEELGFFGSALLVLVFAFLLWRLLCAARRSKEEFGFVLAIGVFSLIFSQFLINVGMNLGLMPITGITLPLVSYGGSSLVAVLIVLGIGENIARLGKRNSSLI